MAGRGAIDEHVDRLMPLLAEGGFLPALDDMAAPDMSWALPVYDERLQRIRL